MALKYRYVFLIATNGFKTELVKTLLNFSDLEELECVVVVNGPDSERIQMRYLEACRFSKAKFLFVREKGKSKALNHYISSLQDPNIFIIFTDDDIIIEKTNIQKYIQLVENHGRGYFYGGGVDVVREVEVNEKVLPLYPASIRGLSEYSLPKKKIYLGCNWGAFAEDIKKANLFNPYFGPGSITGSVGQESQMMHKLLKLGIQPFPIPDCRVTHHAPKNYHELSWLMNRKYREGLQKGLLTNNFARTIVKSAIPIFRSGDAVKRRAALHFLKGMIASLRFRFSKIR